jgi:TrmH RNA methyltransferase
LVRSSIEKVYGLRAVLAVHAARPGDITRIAYGERARYELGELLREAAQRRVAYEERSDEDLERIAGSPHHEGVCIATLPRPLLEGRALVERAASGLTLALDGVTNPHNLGAIVRSMAWFGAGTLVLPPSAGPALTPAAVRVAEGGAEHVAIGRAEIAPLLAAVRARGSTIAAADARGTIDARRYAFRGRTVLVMGAERTGVREATLAEADVVLSIGGAQRVESLNVSVAAGVLLALATR